MSDRIRNKTRYPGVTYRDSQRGRIYIVGYTDGTGRYHTKHMPVNSSLKDAVDEQSRLNVRKANGEMLIPSRKTVGELLDSTLDIRRADLAERTVEMWVWAIENHLKPEFGYLRASELSPAHIANLISKKKQKGLKTWTIKKMLSPLGAAYKVAARDGLVSSSPLTKLLPHEKPKRDQREMRCLEREEISKLLGACESARWKSLFSVLIFCGLRISEALALTWEDIGTEVVVVRQSKTQAGIREVILPRDVRGALMAWKLEQAPGLDLVFATSKNACDRRRPLRVLHELTKKCNLPRYTLHELRHTFVSILIARRELPTHIAEQAGHTDPSFTMKVYAHKFKEQESMDESKERLETWMEGMV